MRVHFESNVDDSVNLNLRLIARSKVLRGGRVRDYIPVGILYGLAMGAVVWMLLRNREEQWAYSAAMGSFAAVAIIVLSPWRVRQRLRRYYREQYGTDESFDVDVELLPEGISVKRLGCRMIFDWDTLQEVHEAPEFLDLRMQHGGLVCVKKSAFESEFQMLQFLDEVKRRITENQPRK